MARARDTLELAKRMFAAGMSKDKSEAIAEAIGNAEVDTVTRADLEAALAQMERRMMVFGFMLAVAASAGAVPGIGVLRSFGAAMP